VQAVVNRPGWQYGQALSLIIQGTGTVADRRVMRSFESDPAFAPRLIITFVPGPMTNQNLEVIAQTAQTVNVLTVGANDDPFTDVLVIPPTATPIVLPIIVTNSPTLPQLPTPIILGTAMPIATLVPNLPTATAPAVIVTIPAVPTATMTLQPTPKPTSSNTQNNHGNGEHDDDD
jgi:hypothetical protein